MTGKPAPCEGRPDGEGAFPADPEPTQDLDLLSGLLRSVHLRGQEIFCLAPAPPFSISFAHPGGTIHILSEGKLDLELDGQRRSYHYGQGDVVLLPAGRAHVVRSGRRVAPRAPNETDTRNEIVRHVSGTHWLSGTFSFDDSRGGRLLHALPPVIELRGAQGQSLVWLDVSTQMLMHEKISPSEGSAEMISRILDLLFIQVLRAWAAGPGACAGWLTGAMDAVIGGALTAVHANPGHPWTVQRLADKCYLSRSAFSERFVRTVGQTPAAYITQVRLDKASDLLQYTTEAVSAISSDVGYDSEAAFSRAFSKRYGMSPSKWRRQPAGEKTDRPGPRVE
jgi:AraC-like DNA-binding protein